MQLQTVECKNCGTNLEVGPGDEFVKCPSCRSPHQIERGPDGMSSKLSLKNARVSQSVQ